MTILDVLTIPNPILNQVCSPVTEFDSSLKELVNDMYDTMHSQQGIGLAAPQVGILSRLFICEFENEKLTLINPEIIDNSGEVISQEGCLSIPDTLVEVDRFSEVTVQAQDLEGNAFTVQASGMMAIIIQHENDHLNGTLITSIGKIIEKDENDVIN